MEKAKIQNILGIQVKMCMKIGRLLKLNSTIHMTTKHKSTHPSRYYKYGIKKSGQKVCEKIAL